MLNYLIWQNKMNYNRLISIVNILFMLLFFSLLIPYLLRSQIDVMDGVTKIEQNRIHFTFKLDTILININLYIQWISIITSIIGFKLFTNYLIKAICVLNILLAFSMYLLLLFVMMYGWNSKNIF